MGIRLRENPKSSHHGNEYKEQSDDGENEGTRDERSPPLSHSFSSRDDPRDWRQRDHRLRLSDNNLLLNIFNNKLISRHIYIDELCKL